MVGFTPPHTTTSPSGAANALHWSILLTPNSSEPAPTSTRPKKMSLLSSQIRLTKTNSNTPAPETALFDMHNHQLRQQEYPVPVEGGQESTTEPRRTTTDITSEMPNKPHTLSLRVVLATSSLPVPKLAQKVSTLLYRTPTYGPAEDWLRASLGMLAGSGVLEPAPAYEADAVLAFAGQAVKEYLELTRHQGYSDSQPQVLDLDYAKHVRGMESVRAMFSHAPTGAANTSAGTQQPTSATPKVQSRRSSLVPSFKEKKHKFFGFRISPSPSAYSQRWAVANTAGEKRAYFERQDDPYGGLM